VLYWEARVDGCDVKFVLGGSNVKDPEFHFTTAELQEGFWQRWIQLWMLYFNIVHGISRDNAGVDQAVYAWRTSGPYFRSQLLETGLCLFSSMCSCSPTYVSATT
jgi:hypothetical protein